MNVRGAPGILVISPWVRARSDRHETVRTLIVRQQSTAAGEIWIERRGMIVELMAITSCGVCLPQFDQRPANWMAVIVDNFPAHDDPFAERFTCMLARQIGIGRANGIAAKDGVEYGRRVFRQ